MLMLVTDIERIIYPTYQNTLIILMLAHSKDNHITTSLFGGYKQSDRLKLLVT